MRLNLHRKYDMDVGGFLSEAAVKIQRKAVLTAQKSYKVATIYCNLYLVYNVLSFFHRMRLGYAHPSLETEIAFIPKM